MFSTFLPLTHHLTLRGTEEGSIPAQGQDLNHQSHDWETSARPLSHSHLMLPSGSSVLLNYQVKLSSYYFRLVSQLGPKSERKLNLDVWARLMAPGGLPVPQTPALIPVAHQDEDEPATSDGTSSIKTRNVSDPSVVSTGSLQDPHRHHTRSLWSIHPWTLS